MTGVEILATEEVAVAFESWNWSNFWLCIAIAFFVAVIWMFIAGIFEDYTIGIAVFSFVLLFSSCILAPIVGATTGEPTEYETQYKVTIDDSVSMNEFNEKYEIVDQDGRIYTVRERE